MQTAKKTKTDSKKSRDRDCQSKKGKIAYSKKAKRQAAKRQDKRK